MLLSSILDFGKVVELPWPPFYGGLGQSGADLVWAQAVPANTPIGVVTYQGTPLNCNVTASEGGGGVANLNGNVWKGNTYQKIVPCLPAQ